MPQDLPSSTSEPTQVSGTNACFPFFAVQTIALHECIPRQHGLQAAEGVGGDERARTTQQALLQNGWCPPMTVLRGTNKMGHILAGA
jgi:hypothetical protein